MFINILNGFRSRHMLNLLDDDDDNNDYDNDDDVDDDILLVIQTSKTYSAPVHELALFLTSLNGNIVQIPLSGFSPCFRDDIRLRALYRLYVREFEKACPSCMYCNTQDNPAEKAEILKQTS
uniref:Uncharacterized protein n=1 Tax=Glossina brevipalpis TaxID=37001 RepID=A0A1A9W8G4_9MUSC